MSHLVSTITRLPRKNLSWPKWLEDFIQQFRLRGAFQTMYDMLLRSVFDFGVRKYLAETMNSLTFFSTFWI
jgi:hypothetical protein